MRVVRINGRIDRIASYQTFGLASVPATDSPVYGQTLPCADRTLTDLKNDGTQLGRDLRSRVMHEMVIFAGVRSGSS